MTPGQRGVLVFTAALVTSIFAGFVCMMVGQEYPWLGMLFAFAMGLFFGFMTKEN